MSHLEQKRADYLNNLKAITEKSNQKWAAENVLKSKTEENIFRGEKNGHM